MCIYLNRNSKLEVAKTDISVIKVLSKQDDKLYPPIYSTIEYVINQLHSSTLMIKHAYNNFYYDFNVYQCNTKNRRLNNLINKNSVKNFNKNKNNYINTYTAVRYGLCSFNINSYKSNSLYNFLSGKTYIGEPICFTYNAIIPKGSLFITDNNGEIISTQLIIKNQI